MEGAETSILAGAAGLIRQFKLIIHVEVTINPVASLDEYVRCTYPGSPNCLLLPQGHRLLEMCRRLGYQRQSVGMNLTLIPIARAVSKRGIPHRLG